MIQKESKPVASRYSFGEAILELGKTNESIVVLEADLGKSTQSYRFAQRFPNRYFQMGIAEANMIGTATGLALSSKVAFICSFCVFVTGRYDTIRMSIAYSKANVKIIGTHAGIATGPDGNSQQAIEDISIMRSLPNMVVVQPCDYIETKKLIAYACEYKGPMFIRLTRQPLQPIYSSEDYHFQFGKGVLLKEGRDLTLFATGGTVYPCLKAAKDLENEGVSVAVVNIHTIKPIDKELIVAMAQKTKLVMTVEDHSVIGGLGTAVAEVLAEQSTGHLKRIGLPDCFGESGTPDELYAKFGLDAEGIKRASKNFVKS